MSFTELFIYSFIQGLTEFLPISSSAHLVIIENIFGWTKEGRTFAIAAHLGTLLTVLIYLRYEIISVCKNLNLNNYSTNDENYKTIVNIIIITMPIIILGLIVFKTLDIILLNLQLIAFATLVGALILLISDQTKFKNKTLSNLSYKESILIGMMQSLALIPGASRAGMIIAASRFLNINRSNSAKIALFTGIPTILCAVILEAFWLIKNTNYILSYSLIIVVALSFMFSYFSIYYLFKWIDKNSFLPFIIYRFIMGMFILAIIYL